MASARYFRTGLAVTALALLAGCADQPVASFESPKYLAEAAQAQTDVYFQPGSARFAAGEVQRLRTMLKAQVLRPTDDVLVYVPSSGNARIDAERGGAARSAVGAVPARVRLFGPPGFVYTETRPDALFVQVMRYDQVQVDCVNSGRNAFETTMLVPFPAMGCTNALNRANMAAELRDLTAPRVLGDGRAVTDVAAIKRYDDGTLRQPPWDINDASGS